MAVDLGDLMARNCRHGVQVWPQSDQIIGRALALYGEFAESENRMMARYLPQGGVALDVGANIGTTTLAMAAKVGPKGNVLAFEPQPIVARCLAAALVLNGIAHVRLFTTAVGQANAMVQMDFSATRGGGNHGEVAITLEGDPVPMIRLDDLNLPRCDLLKVDVEGFELQVFHGAQHMITDLTPAIYFEAKRSPNTEASIALLMGLGYRCYWHFSFYFSPHNFHSKSENVFVNLGDMNVLALPLSADQPKDLPEIAKSDEDWKDTYGAFFKARKIAMP